MRSRLVACVLLAVPLAGAQADAPPREAAPGSTAALLLQPDPRLDLRQPFWEGRVASGTAGVYGRPIRAVYIDGFQFQPTGDLTPDLGLFPAWVISSAELTSGVASPALGPYGGLHFGFSKPDSGEVRTTLGGERGHLQTRSRGLVDIERPGGRPFRVGLDRRTSIALYRSTPATTTWDGIVEPRGHSLLAWAKPTEAIEVLYMTLEGRDRPGLSTNGTATLLQDRDTRLLGVRARLSSLVIEAQQQAGTGTNLSPTGEADTFDDDHSIISLAGNAGSLFEWKGAHRRSKSGPSPNVASLKQTDLSIHREWGAGESQHLAVDAFLAYLQEAEEWVPGLRVSGDRELSSSDRVRIEVGRWDRPLELFEQSYDAQLGTESGWEAEVKWAHSSEGRFDLHYTLMGIEWDQQWTAEGAAASQGVEGDASDRSLESFIRIDEASWHNIRFTAGWGMGVSTFESGLSHLWTASTSWTRKVDSVHIGIDTAVRGSLRADRREASTAWSARARITEDFLIRFVAEHAWSTHDHRNPSYYFDLHWSLWG